MGIDRPRPSGALRKAAGQVLALAAPVMAGNLVESLYNLTDAFFLGKLGTAEIGAPSVAFPIVFFITIFGSSFSGAGTTLIAQCRGRRDDALMRFYLGQTASLVFGVSAFLLLAGEALSPLFLSGLGVPGIVYGHAEAYLRIIFLGLPAVFAYFLLQAGFTAIGDTFTPLKIHLVGIALNVMLDPVLIFGLGPIPGLGVAGAAMATVASQYVTAFLCLRALVRGRDGLRLERANLKPSGEALRLLLRIGVPSGVGQGLSAFGFAVLQGVVNGFGPAAIAAFGVGNRIIGLLDIPAMGIAGAVTSLVGRALGARDEAKARDLTRGALLLVLVLESPILLLSMFFGGSFVRFFVDDPEAIRLGSIMFMVVSPSVLMFCLYTSLTGALNGAGDTKTIMVLSIVRLWGIRVPLAYALAYWTRLGPLSIWLAMFVSNLFTAAAGALYFRTGKWKHALVGTKLGRKTEG